MPVSGLVITEHDSVLTIAFDRPEAFNAFSGEMVLEVCRLLEESNARDEVRVVVLTGTGAAFSTGANVGSAAAVEQLDSRAMDAANRLIRAIVSCDKPVLAAVNGIAAGVGLSAALACDVIVAKESASFLLAFARIGLMPDGGAVATMSASLGRSKTMAMSLLGDPVPARTAYDAGLISHLAADDEFDAEVTRLVKRLSSRRAVGPGRDETSGERGDPGSPRECSGERAQHPDDAPAHLGRPGGDDRLRREAPPGFPRRLTAGQWLPVSPLKR